VISLKNLKYAGDIVKTLRDLKKIDFSVYEPQVRVSEASNEALKDAENKAYQLKYQIEMQEYLSRNRAFEDNQRVAHGCIMKDYVTKEMKKNWKWRSIGSQRSWTIQWNY